MERLFEANNNDAGKAYFRSSTDIVSVIATLIKLVKETRRNGLFFYYNELNNDLLRYELLYPPQTNLGLKLKHSVFTTN
jgi:hypothetical protein